MGRWVTSKGRRIYIPDEGEENPYAKTRTENQTRQDELKQQIKKLEKHAFNKDARVVLDELRAREDEHRRFEADKEDMDERLEELKKKEKQLTKTDAFNPQARSILKDLRARIDEIQKIKRNDEHEIPTSKKVKSKEESIKEKQIKENKRQADERNGKIKPYYVDQETQILDKKMSSRGKMIYAKSEEEALSQYKKDYPKGNARIKESKYPEHIKRAQELNKKQTDKRNKKIEKQEVLDTYYQKSLELSMRADDPRYKERLRKRKK